MAHIFIEYVTDYYDCETCGGNYAEGAVVEVDGVSIGDFYPSAHCYAGDSYSMDEIYSALMEFLGIEVKKDEHGYLEEDFNLEETLKVNGHTLEESEFTISNDFYPEDDDWDDYDDEVDPEDHEEWDEDAATRV